MNLSFYSLSSGSSGNSYFLGNGEEGILVDAGISALAVRRALRETGLDQTRIMGILVTHNHTDHTRGLEVLARRHNIPVYTTSLVWKSIHKTGSRVSKHLFREIETEKRFEVAGFRIEAFEVSHDAPQTLGYHIDAGERKITIATDLGYICERAAHFLSLSDTIVLESNYDEDMLVAGSYPWFLKRRISSDSGHLSNVEAARFLASHFSPGVRAIALAHLSKNNNTPARAMEALESALTAAGATVNGNQLVAVLPRHSHFPIITPGS